MKLVHLKWNELQYSNNNMWFNFGPDDKMITIQSYKGAGPLFTKRSAVLPQDFAKSLDSGLAFINRSEIWQAPHSSATEMPVKFQSDQIRS